MPSAQAPASTAAPNLLTSTPGDPPAAPGCSRRAGDGANYGFQFRGARIVSAVLQSLVQVHGMGSNGPGEKLIFGGCSAVRGGRKHA